jgi:hypothetical protein
VENAVTITIPDREFKSFEKINRAKTGFGCVMTEKLDGSNAQILIEDGKIVGVGSRQRWIKPGKEHDNFGFAAWVERNEEELLRLGDGAHFGEWYGSGIQRAYGLTGGDKRFALFNTGRWSNDEIRPACCECVPVLFAGEFTRENVNMVMRNLAEEGSRHVPGFMRPEGIVIFIPGSRSLLKETFEFSDGKWKADNANASAVAVA